MGTQAQHPYTRPTSLLSDRVHSGVNTSTVQRSLTLILVAFDPLGMHLGQHHFHSSPLSGATFATVQDAR